MLCLVCMWYLPDRFLAWTWTASLSLCRLPGNSQTKYVCLHAKLALCLLYGVLLMASVYVFGTSSSNVKMNDYYFFIFLNKQHLL